MDHYLVLFGTKRGQSRLIAERIAHELRHHGQHVSVRDLAAPAWAQHGPLFDTFGHVVVVAPLYAGRYLRGVRKFLERNLLTLSKLKTTLVSVSLTQAAVDDETKSPQERREAAEGLLVCVQDLEEQTGFRPDRVVHVAGSLWYRKYNFVTRWLMKRIARQYGASTDTSKNHEFTNWPAVVELASKLADESAKGAGEIPAVQTQAHIKSRRVVVPTDSTARGA